MTDLEQAEAVLDGLRVLSRAGLRGNLCPSCETRRYRALFQGYVTHSCTSCGRDVNVLRDLPAPKYCGSCGAKLSRCFMCGVRIQ